jgi:hypothetical protein
MSNFWQPKIDRWSESVNVNNTAAFSTSYQYAPAEGEEGNHKTHISGVGTMTFQQLRDKIKDKLSTLAGAADSEDLGSMEHVYYELFTSPELNNLLKQYTEILRKIKASKIA